jgi:hypothetical protein
VVHEDTASGGVLRERTSRREGAPETAGTPTEMRAALGLVEGRTLISGAYAAAHFGL